MTDVRNPMLSLALRCCPSPSWACQIASGVMSGEGVRVLMTVGATEFDCTAEIEG